MLPDVSYVICAEKSGIFFYQHIDLGLLYHLLIAFLIDIIFNLDVNLSLMSKTI